MNEVLNRNKTNNNNNMKINQMKIKYTTSAKSLISTA